MSTPARIVYFPQVAASPVLVAHSEGFFEREDLASELAPTPDSSHLVQGLVDGRYDFAVALADNFVAYQGGQHSVPRKPGQELAILVGLAETRALLLARPEILNTADLRGRRIGVDAPHTGFALMLRGMLQGAGLKIDEVELVRSGSTAYRLEALLQRTIDATVLTPEFAAVAEAAGFRRCGDTQQEMGRCLGMAVGINRRWAAEHHDVIASFLRAVQLAATWIAVQSNRRKAAKAVATALGIAPDVAHAEIDRLYNSGDLAIRNPLEVASLEPLLNLRRQFISPPIDLEPDEMVLDFAAEDRPGWNGIV